MSRYNRLAVNLVMVLLGVMLIVGSALSMIGTTIFPFDQWIGTRASAAGIAFGVGVAAAGVHPRSHISWVRLAVLYCLLDVVYEAGSWIVLGSAGFAPVPFLISLIFAGLLVFLYPDRGRLVPTPQAVEQTAPSAARG